MKYLPKTKRIYVVRRKKRDVKLIELRKKWQCSLEQINTEKFPVTLWEGILKILKENSVQKVRRKKLKRGE